MNTSEHPQDFNQSKFSSLVHYVCSRCSDPTKLGAIKLNKILWFSDRLSYVMTGQSIAGETYIKRQFGPVPEHILRTIRTLESSSDIVTRETHKHEFPKREFIALTEPDISTFSPQEISWVDQIIEAVCENHTAESISNISHDDIWKLAEIGEVIPLNAVLASRLGEVNERDMKWAREALSPSAV